MPKGYCRGGVNLCVTSQTHIGPQVFEVTEQYSRKKYLHTDHILYYFTHAEDIVYGMQVVSSSVNATA
jgi:hypothetical protein